MPDTLTYLASTDNVNAPVLSGNEWIVCSCDVSYVPEGYTKATIEYRISAPDSYDVSLAYLKINGVNMQQDLTTRTYNVSTGDFLIGYAALSVPKSGYILQTVITLSK